LRHSILSLAFLFSLLLPSSSLAETGANCIKLTVDSVRLACFDFTFGASGTQNQAPPDGDSASVVPAQTGGNTGKWLKIIDKSKMTDAHNVYISLESENSIAGQFGTPGPAILTLRCQENTTSVLFHFNDQFVASIQGYGKLEYRLDTDRMRAINTQESTNNKALGLWSGRRAIPFMKSLLGHHQLVVRATPYNASPVTITYAISGLENVIGDLRKTCHW